MPGFLFAVGLALIAAGLIAAFSTLGLILFIAGVMLTPAAVFLQRLEATAAPLALLETVGIMVLLVLLGGALWWLGAMVAGA